MPHSRRLILQFSQALAGNVSGHEPPLEFYANQNALKKMIDAQIIGNKAFTGPRNLAIDGSTSTYCRIDTVGTVLMMYIKGSALPKKLWIYSGSSYQAAGIELYGVNDDGTGSQDLLCSGTCIATSNWDEFAISSTKKYTCFALKFTSFRSSYLNLYDVEITSDIYVGNERAFTVKSTEYQYSGGPLQLLTSVVQAVRAWQGKVTNFMRGDWLDNWNAGKITFNNTEWKDNAFRLKEKYKLLTTDAAGKTVTTDNGTGTYVFNPAGAGNTWYPSTIATHWAMIDYGSPVYVNRATYYQVNATYGVKSFTLEGSADGASFEHVWSFSDISQASGWKPYVDIIPGKLFRYFRVSVSTSDLFYPTSRMRFGTLTLEGLKYWEEGTLGDYMIDLNGLDNVSQISTALSPLLIPDGSSLSYEAKLDSGAYTQVSNGNFGLSGNLSTSKLYIQIRMFSTKDRATPSFVRMDTVIQQDVSAGDMIEIVLRPDSRMRKPESIAIMYNSALGSLAGESDPVDAFETTIDTFKNLRRVPNPCMPATLGGQTSFGNGPGNEFNLHVANAIYTGLNPQCTMGGKTNSFIISLYVAGSEPV